MFFPVDSLTTICWHVDVSCGMYSSCKGHTGIMMTLRAGASMSMLKIHKLNSNQSTELEVVGIDNALPDILWGKYFTEA